MNTTSPPATGGRYATDDRVRRDGMGGYIVTRGDGRDIRIVNRPLTGWAAATLMGTAVTAGGQLVEHRVSADDAIRAIIGDPR